MWFIDACKDAWNEVEAEWREKHRLKRGCVIRDKRILYSHYGIYAGSREVIHFSEGKVRRQALRHFTGYDHGEIEVMSFDEDVIRHISLEDSYERAKSKVGLDGYDLFHNNCEHFALWCRTGKAISTQSLGSISPSLAASFAITDILTYFNNDVGMKTSRSVFIDDIHG